MQVDDNIFEELIEAAQVLWEWLPLDKKNQLPLFRRAIGRASFLLRERMISKDNKIDGDSKK